jgi:hypothetical protein
MAIGKKGPRKFVVQRRTSADPQAPLHWCDHWQLSSLKEAYDCLDQERGGRPYGWRLLEVIEDEWMPKD